MPDLWVDNRHPEFELERSKRQFARDQFTGDALIVSQYEASKMTDPASEAGGERELSRFMDISGIEGRSRLSLSYLGGHKTRPNNGTYLRRRALGESAAAFRERASITRFPSHMPTLIEAYVGGVAAVERKWKRTWGEPLGDPADKDSKMFRMWHDIDGTGRNWRAANNTLLKNLIVDDVVWTYTELGSADYPRTHILDPNRIVDWHDEDGIPVWLLMREDKLVRPDMHKPAQTQVFYTEYDVDGWNRYRLIEEEGEERDLEWVDGEEWVFPLYDSPDKSRKCIPFTRFRLSDIMGRHVGFQMAMDHNMLYNILSDARWNFRVINNPRLVLQEGTKDSFTQALSLVNEGHNALLGPWAYISPDYQNGLSAYQVYVQEVTQFYITNHQRVNRSAIERSATEIQFDEAAGRTSFLSIITDAIDEIENRHLFLSSQLEAPKSPESWLNARVERSRDFKPIDIQNLAQTQANSFSIFAQVFDAELAAKAAKEGLTEEIVEEIRLAGNDNVVDVEQ